jgi:hypothetical protein
VDHTNTQLSICHLWIRAQVIELEIEVKLNLLRAVKTGNP